MAAKKRAGRPKKYNYYGKVNVSLRGRTVNNLILLYGDQAAKMTFDEMVMGVVFDALRRRKVDSVKVAELGALLDEFEKESGG